MFFQDDTPRIFITNVNRNTNDNTDENDEAESGAEANRLSAPAGSQLSAPIRSAQIKLVTKSASIKTTTTEASTTTTEASTTQAIVNSNSSQESKSESKRNILDNLVNRKPTINN